MANGEGITYTTKELLARIEIKIDALDSKLDEKAEKASVDALQVQLELIKETMVKRDGPLMREYWEYTHETRSRLEMIEKDMIQRASYIPILEKNVNKTDKIAQRFWMILGGITVAAGLATANAIRLFFGF